MICLSFKMNTENRTNWNNKRPKKQTLLKKGLEIEKTLSIEMICKHDVTAKNISDE